VVVAALLRGRYYLHQNMLSQFKMCQLIWKSSDI